MRRSVSIAIAVSTLAGALIGVNDAAAQVGGNSCANGPVGPSHVGAALPVLWRSTVSAGSATANSQIFVSEYNPSSHKGEDVFARDRSEIKVTTLVLMIIGRTHVAAVAAINTYIANHNWPAEAFDMLRPRMTIGDPDEIGAAIQELVELGVDGITLNLAANAHDPEMIALAGQTVGAVLGGGTA